MILSYIILFSFENSFTFSNKAKLFFIRAKLLIIKYKNENSLISIDVKFFLSLKCFCVDFKDLVEI